MTAGWCVRVSVFDDLVVSISERELCGRDLTEADKELICGCARHLLAFAGSRFDADFAVDPVHEIGTEGFTRAKSFSSLSLQPSSLPPGAAPPPETET
jgi:hypothetical protein